MSIEFIAERDFQTVDPAETERLQADATALVKAIDGEEIPTKIQVFAFAKSRNKENIWAIIESACILANNRWRGIDRDKENTGRDRNTGMETTKLQATLTLLQEARDYYFLLYS